MRGQDDSLLLERYPALYLVHDTPKGRGVFAGRPIPSGTIIDVSPVLVLDACENREHVARTALYHYTYNWPLADSPGTTQAVVLGIGSLFNHSTSGQNIGWHRDRERQVIVYRALRDISEGEELCISYGDHLTFVDADHVEREAMVEDVEQVLGRIQVDT